MKQFIQKNKVLLLGALGSIGVVLNEFLSKPDVSWKAISFAIFATLLSYFANNLRGKAASIAGILGTLFATFMTMNENGTISWGQLGIQAAVAFLAVVAPPAKPDSYEK